MLKILPDQVVNGRITVDLSTVKFLHVNNLDMLEEIPVCPELEELNMWHCPKIKSLPHGMLKLRYLYCTGCTSLQEFPTDLVNLTFLSCKGCISLEYLPVHLPNLIQLDISLCNLVKEIPFYPLLRCLSCNGCNLITQIPSYPELETLDCVRCENLEFIPYDMRLLRILNCAYSSKLVNVPFIRYDKYYNQPTLNISGCYLIPPQYFPKRTFTNHCPEFNNPAFIVLAKCEYLSTPLLEQLYNVMYSARPS